MFSVGTRENVIANIRTIEPGFLRTKTHALDKPIKALSREVEDTIDRLRTLSQSENEKIAVKACEQILAFYSSMVKQKDLDELQRLLLNVKYGAPKDDDDNSPIVDFANIKEIE